MSLLRFPSIIRDLSENLMPETTPEHAIRLSGDLNGASGESYILGYENQTCFFSRSSGQYDYTHFMVNNSAVMHPRIEEERFNEFLQFTVNGQHYSLKFPRYDRDDVDALIHHWNAAEPPATGHDNVAGTPHPATLKPAVGFLAMLIYAATCDGELDDREENYIEALCHHDQESLKQALAFYKSRSLDDLLAAVKGFDTPQKLCLITNLVEVVMSDGVLHSREQQLITTICEGLGVGDDLYNQINDVLMVKNQTSVLGL